MDLSVIIDDEKVMSLVNKDELWKMVNDIISNKVTELVRDWVYFCLREELEERLEDFNQPLKVTIYHKLDEISVDLAKLITNDIDKIISTDTVREKLANELLASADHAEVLSDMAEVDKDEPDYDAD